MGIRISKSKQIGPLKINLGKHGIGYSWGNKFYRRTKTTTGKVIKTLNLPGKGISYVFKTKK